MLQLKIFFRILRESVKGSEGYENVVKKGIQEDTKCELSLGGHSISQVEEENGSSRQKKECRKRSERMWSIQDSV